MSGKYVLAGICRSLEWLARIVGECIAAHCLGYENEVHILDLALSAADLPSRCHC